MTSACAQTFAATGSDRIRCRVYLLATTASCLLWVFRPLLVVESRNIARILLVRVVRYDIIASLGSGGFLSLWAVKSSAQELLTAHSST